MGGHSKLTVPDNPDKLMQGMQRTCPTSSTMPRNTIHVNSEMDGGNSLDMKSFGFIEIFARLSGMYCDPFGRHTVLKWQSWRLKLLSITSTFDTFFYMAAYCVWAIKTLLLVTPTDGFNQRNLLALCFIIQYIWLFVFGVVISFLLPKRLPHILDKLRADCSDAGRPGFLSMPLIITLIFLIGTSIVIYAHRNMYLPLTDTAQTFSDSIRLYPFELGTLEGRLLAVIYIFLSTMALMGLVFISALMVKVCIILGREFSRITSGLRVLLEDKSDQEMENDLKSEKLEGLRQHYERVCDLVSQADEVIKYTALIGFFFGILVFCFTLYCISIGNLDPKEIGTILVLMTISVSQIITYTITGSYLSAKAHSARDVLFKFKVTDMNIDTYKTIHLFLARVTGQPVGITMFGTFTIDRTSTLTVLGTILSYGVLVLQLSPSTSNTIRPCFNVTTI